jgi:hypothetical protein
MTEAHILIATDGSTPSLDAARLVRDLLNPAALARVTIVAVVQPLEETTFYTPYGGSLSPGAWDEMTAQAERAARDTLERTAEEVGMAVPVSGVAHRSRRSCAAPRRSARRLLPWGAAVGARRARSSSGVCPSACCTPRTARC